MRDVSGLYASFHPVATAGSVNLAWCAQPGFSDATRSLWLAVLYTVPGGFTAKSVSLAGTGW